MPSSSPASRPSPLYMVPGPTRVHPAALEVMTHDFASGDLCLEFVRQYTTAAKRLQKIMGTQNEVVIMTGEGMLALWAGLKSCLAPGDRVLAVGTGFFGDGIGEMAQSFGCQVTPLSLPYDSTLGCADSLERIEAAVKATHPKMITAVHCETPSGTLNPLQALGEIKKRLGVPLLYVDAVASAGGVPVRADDWNIDLLLTGSQKCLSLPPSLSMVGVSQTAWDIMEKVNYQGYDALLPFRGQCSGKNPAELVGTHPYTPYWHAIAALDTVTQLLEKEGLEAVFARHERVAAQCRNGLASLGVQIFPVAEAVSSPTVTAACIPAGLPWKEWNTRLQRQGISAAGSYGPLADKVFRLGHMGTQADAALMQQVLSALEKALESN